MIIPAFSGKYQLVRVICEPLLSHRPTFEHNVESSPMTSDLADLEGVIDSSQLSGKG